MKRQQILASLMITAIFVVAIGSQATQVQSTEDPIIASFDRSLHHEAGPAAMATGSDIDNDILYELVNQPLQSGADND